MVGVFECLLDHKPSNFKYTRLKMPCVFFWRQKANQILMRQGLASYVQTLLIPSFGRKERLIVANDDDNRKTHGNNLTDKKGRQTKNTKLKKHPKLLAKIRQTFHVLRIGTRSPKLSKCER
jgi:predicted membrane metal-binding protein